MEGLEGVEGSLPHRREPPLVADPERVTAEWLTDVLRFSASIDPVTEVAAFTSSPVGTGQVGAIFRFEVAYRRGPGPATVIGKFASPDPASASIGVLTRTYETEVDFYCQLAGTVDVDCPRCQSACTRSTGCPRSGRPSSPAMAPWSRR